MIMTSRHFGNQNKSFLRVIKRKPKKNWINVTLQYTAKDYN